MADDGGLLDRMEGVVLSLDDGAFTAHLVDQRGKETTAEIWISQARPEDVHKIRPGAMFVWEFYMDSTLHARSRIVFQEVPDAG